MRQATIASSSDAPAPGAPPGEVAVAPSPGQSDGAPESRPTPLVARILRVVVVVLAAGYAVQVAVGRWLASPETVLGAEMILLMAAGAVLVVLRARRVRGYRPMWLMLALGLLCAVFSDVYVAVAPAPLPVLSPADAGWLGLYLFAYLGMAAGIWHDSARDRARVLLDGAVSGLGSAAVFSQVLLDVAMAPIRGSGIQRVLALAYPVCDSFLIAMAVCGLAAGGWSRRPSLRLAGVAMLGWALADAGYNVMHSTNTYAFGGAVDVAYVVTIACLGLAAWLPDTRRGADQGAGGARLTLPVVFAVVALGQLLLASQRPISAVSVCLDGLTLLAGTARSVVSFRQTQDLGRARHREARRDELTGLANRRAYHEHLDGWATRQPRPPIAVLLLDLDRFKQVNDTLGHAAGDQLLVGVTERLRHAVRAGDFVARLGGDEFVIVVTGPVAGDHRQVDELATRVRGQLRDPFDLDGRRADIDVSIGISFDLDAGGTPEDLLHRADLAMYEAKKSRTGHQTYRDPDEPLAGPLEAIELLRRDIGTDAMVVHYQPKIELATGAVLGVEALVRWRHPDQGLLRPRTFLALADEAGLMPVLTANVLRQAIAQCVRWRAAGAPLSLSVNITGADLRGPEFPGEVADLLHTHGLPPGALILEIAEATALSEDDRTWETVGRLREQGIGISFDDCGAGPVGLAQVRRLLAAGELKLDQQLLSGMDDDPESATTVRAGIVLAHALGAVVVAEGVESATMLHRLAELRVDAVQGHLLGKPQTAASLTGWLGRHLMVDVARHSG
jgi:diguanylate cyclase (GGDEF)-like protein